MTPKLLKIDTVLGRFFPSDIDHRNVTSESLDQRAVPVDIDFANGCMEFMQKRCNRGFRFLAEVTPGSGVNGYFRTSTGLIGARLGHRYGLYVHLTHCQMRAASRIRTRKEAGIIGPEDF